MNYTKRKYYAEVAITEMLMEGFEFHRPIADIVEDIVYRNYGKLSFGVELQVSNRALMIQYSKDNNYNA